MPEWQDYRCAGDGASSGDVFVFFMCSYYANVRARHAVGRGMEPRAVSFLIRTAGACAWPVVARHLCQSTGSPVSSKAECVRTSVLWVALAWLYDVMILMHDPDGDPFSGVTVDASAFPGLVFGLASFVGCQPSSAASDMFLASILGCFFLVACKDNLCPGSKAALVARNVQKVLLTYCVGAMVIAMRCTRCASGA